MASTSDPPLLRRQIGAGGVVVILLLTAAFVWRLVFFVEIYASPYGDHLTLDSEAYHHAAVAAATGRWSPGTAFYQAPFYGWVLGSLYAITGPSQSAAKMLQIIAGVFTCWLVYGIGRRFYGERAGRIALLMSAVYGGLIFFGNELLPVTLVTLLNLTAIRLMLLAGDRESRALWPAAGAALGLSAITRPTILTFLAAAAIWVAWSGRRTPGPAKAAGSAGLLLAGAAVVIAPVTIHNFVVDGDLVPVATNGGINFYIGNNPLSDGFTAEVPGLRGDLVGAREDQLHMAREALGDPRATGADASRYWFGRGWQYISDEPVEALGHTVKKAWFLLNAHEISNTRVIGFVARHSRIYRWATIGFWLVFPLAVVGVFIGRRRGSGVSLLLTYAVVGAATVIPFFITARFRLPLAAATIVFAAAAVDRWWTWLLVWRRGRTAVAMPLSMAVALVVAVMIRPLPELAVPEAQAFFNEAEAYRFHRDWDAAVKWYGEALRAHPGYCDAGFNLGRIQAEVFSDPGSVVGTLEPLVSACSDDLEIRRLLGLALCALGRCNDGIEHLEEIARALPHSESARADLENARRHHHRMTGEPPPFD